MSNTNGTTWYEVSYSEWSPCIEERLVVKETAQMVEYKTTSCNWPTKTHVESSTRARKVSNGREWFADRQQAVDSLTAWLRKREADHISAAEKLADHAANIKIVPIQNPS